MEQVHFATRLAQGFLAFTIVVAILRGIDLAFQFGLVGLA